MRSVLFLIPVCIFAGESDSSILKKALAAYEARDGLKVIELLTPLAEKGNAKAQYYLGAVLSNSPGLYPGVQMDKELGWSWIKKSADQGFAEAEFSVGFEYAAGVNQPEDMEAAMVWTQKAAVHGYVPAMGVMGNAYNGDPDYSGSGIRPDPKLAMSWYRKAAKKGDAHSLAMVGSLYRRGSGVPQDFIEAHAWMNLAASREKIIPEFRAEERDSLARRMTAAQLAKAQARVKILAKELGI